MNDNYIHEPPPPDEPTASQPKKAAQSEQLLKLIADANITFFHDTLKMSYAAIKTTAHTEVWAVNGTQFKTWLQKLFYDKKHKTISGEALKSAIGVLNGKDLYDGATTPLSVRVAEHGGSIFYDLSNKNWQAIMITPDGWQVVNNPPTMFVRYNHQLPQVTPSKYGNVKKLLNLVNVKSEYHLLFLCWLISCFVPDIPHAMPIFFGEKGAAKSTGCEIIKAVIDPSSLATLSLNNDSKAMAINLTESRQAILRFIT